MILLTALLINKTALLNRFCEFLIQDDPHQFEQYEDDEVERAFGRLEMRRRIRALNKEEEITHKILEDEIKRREYIKSLSK